MKLTIILSVLAAAAMAAVVPNTNNNTNGTKSEVVGSDRCDPCNIYYAACFNQCNESPDCAPGALCAECTNDCLIETCQKDKNRCFSCGFPYC
jgi:hypothetical protein